MKVGDKVRFVKSHKDFTDINEGVKTGSVGVITYQFQTQKTLFKVSFNFGSHGMLKSELELIHDIKYFPSMITTLTWSKK